MYQLLEAVKALAHMTHLQLVDQVAVEITRVEHLLQELQTKVMQVDLEAAAELAQLEDHQTEAQV
tara:strand:- start:90 stop:284 length:195 start_codon:yes stop_codon:yes gene_type:complete